MPVTKALVLARGLGRRMREGAAVELRSDQAAAADAGVKAMMPLGRDGDPVARPFLDFVLSAIADAGYRSTCLVVGPDHETIRRYYAATSRPARLAVHFAEQAEPRGTADAVAAAGSYIANDHALVVNGDNYYPVAALAALRATGTAATMLFRLLDAGQARQHPRGTGASLRDLHPGRRRGTSTAFSRSPRQNNCARPDPIRSSA